MAVKWHADANVSRTAHGYSVLPENVIIIPDLSGRLEANGIDDLAKDIEENGQLEPAMCWKNDEGWPVLAAGHRRYRALMKINHDKKEDDKRPLLFNFVDAKTEQDAFDFTIRENRNRLNPSVLDDAHNMSIYANRFKLTEEQIARKYYPGMTTDEELQRAIREVKNCLQLLELSDEAQDELRKGFLTTSAALQLAAIPSRKKQTEVIQEAKAEGKKKLKVADAKAAKEEATGKPTKPRNNISDHTPAKMLERFRDLADLAQALACECLSPEPDGDVLVDLAKSVLGRAYALKVPLTVGFDRMAAELDPAYMGEAVAA